MSLRSLLRVRDLSGADLRALLGRARAHKEDPLGARDLLSGASVPLYFEKPSTRTRLSFETAVHRLGGLPIVVGPNDLQMGRGESVEDTARVISRYARVFVARTFSDDHLARFARASTIPVINALTDGHHPSQAIADLFTIEQRFGSLDGLTVAYVGAGNNVAHSLMEACALVGVHFRAATPPHLAPDPEVVSAARALAEASGASLDVGPDAEAAVRGADAVYTDTWLSMGDPEEERQARAVALTPYRVDGDLMALAKPHAIFMHCLPAHRGDEVTNEVADSRASVIFDQAENKLHTAMAILEGLVRRTLEGGGSD